jgi:uncharacterized membrane protein
MNSIFKAVELLALGVWLGSDAFLSFVVAPGAFRMLGSRDQAGMMVGFALSRMHWIGIVCGVIFLVARLARMRSLGSMASAAALCVLLMIGLTVVSEKAVSPKMAALRMQMGSIQATAADSPLFAEFSRLHRVSVLLESGVLLAGLAAMYLVARESVQAV